VLIFIFGTIITLILFTVPGYLLSVFSSFRDHSTLERIYFGYIVSMAVFVISGFILSFFRNFTPFWIFLFLILYNIASLTLYLKYSKIVYGNKHIPNKNNHRFNLKTFLNVSLFFSTLLICLIYIWPSPFPIGWDRGKHFGRTVFTLNHGMLEMTDPGTDYNPFYFQGLNLIISTLTGASVAFSSLAFDNFSFLVDLSLIFNVFLAWLVSLTVLGIYFLSNNTFRNEKIATLSSIIFISLSGFGFADTPSIGVCVTFLFLSVFFVYLPLVMEKIDINKTDWLFLFLITISIIFMHIIGIAFMILFSTILLCFKFYKREWSKEQIKKFLAVIGISGLFSFLFLLILYPVFVRGVADEIIRKGSTSGFSSELVLISYFSQNIKILQGIGVILFVPLLLSLVTFIWQKKKLSSVVISLAFTSLLFILIPILPFTKPEWYIVYPISTLGGAGIFYVFTLLEAKTKIKNKVWTVIFIYLIIGSVLSASNVYAVSIARVKWYRYDYYNEVYDLSTWLNSKLETPRTILFPQSGPFAYLLNALSQHKILFAEPRFPDIPSFQETARIYLKYPTSAGEFNFLNVSSEERYNIINKYNISVIVETDKIKADINSLKLYYSTAVLFNWYHPTPSYWVIILEPIQPSWNIEEKELLEAPIQVQLPAGPQWVHINITGTNLSTAQILALRIINNNNASKTFFAKIQDTHGNATEQILFTLQPGDKSYYIHLTELKEAIDLSNPAKLTLCFSWYGWEPNIDLTITNMTLITLKN